MSNTMRSRETVVGPNYALQNWHDASGNVISTQTHQLYLYRKSISDVMTPDFKERIAAGEIINNPMTLEFFEEQAGGGSLRVYYLGNLQYYASGGSVTLRHWEEETNKSFPEPEIDRSHHIAHAKQQCLGDLDSSPRDMIEDIFELRESARFLFEGVKTIHGLATDYGRTCKKIRRKINRNGKVKDLLRNEAAAYATFWWGAIPIVRSVLSVADFWKNGYKPRTDIRTARGQSSTKKELSNPAQGNAYNWASHAKASTNVRAYCMYHYDDFGLSRFQREFGFEIKDVPRGLWNVVSKSFMVDRAFDISSFIDGFINLNDPRLTVLTAGYTERFKLETQLLDLGPKSTPAGWTVDVVGDTRTTEYFTFSRTLWRPTFADTLPRLNLPGLVDSKQKIVDLIAILRLGKSLEAQLRSMDS